jgi:hypothetical protein
MIPAQMRPGRPVILAAVAVAALISSAGVALAATASSSAPRTAAKAGTAVSAPEPSPSRCQVKLPPRGLPLRGRAFTIPGPLMPLSFGPFGAIHGQFVAPKPGGGYQTIDTQRGTVTAVSSSSITVKSSDGYIKTYNVTSSTHVVARRAGISTVKTGQTVSVLATISGSSATAAQIVDFTSLPKMPGILRPGSGQVHRIGPCAIRGIRP